MLGQGVTMSLKEKIKRSRFIISCIFFAGYAVYAAYATYYYRTFRNGLSIALLVLIATTFILAAAVTFVSYRINLKNKPRPRLHRFIKMAKYLSQLLSSAVTISLLVSAVHSSSAFSLVVAVLTIPFLLWGLFVNVLAEYFARKFSDGFGKRVYIPSVPRDEEGNKVDITASIAAADALSAAKKTTRKRYGE